MTVSVVRDPIYAAHDPGAGHPESPARVRAIDAALRASDLALHEIPARPATREELARVHTPAYLDQLHALRGRSASLDPDTHLSPRSVDAALAAAGGTIELVRAVARGEAPPGLALVRPPGHHALGDRAMGFCLINNVAVAAQALRAEGLAERIAIYDFDVHHGNGTEAIFYGDPNVLYCSTHQWPFYPGTGARDDTGRGRGEGATLNVPLPEGTGDARMIEVTLDVLGPRLVDFAPDLILISAGFDPYEDDPLGGFQVTVSGFRELALRWRDLAERLTGGKIAGVLEGGYDLDGLGASVTALLEAWST